MGGKFLLVSKETKTKNRNSWVCFHFPFWKLSFLNEEMGVASFKKCDSKTNHTTV